MRRIVFNCKTQSMMEIDDDLTIPEIQPELEPRGIDLMELMIKVDNLKDTIKAELKAEILGEIRRL